MENQDQNLNGRQSGAEDRVDEDAQQKHSPEEQRALPPSGSKVGVVLCDQAENEAADEERSCC
jgi:hypothetical protein